MLEAVATYDLWICHAFFSVASSNNDINILDQSPDLNDIIEEVAPGSSFRANDTEYEYDYYLTIGIYAEWSTFVKSFICLHPKDDKRWYLKKLS
jgi:hypothetical protein